jgi:hypothetical protein
VGVSCFYEAVYKQRPELWLKACNMILFVHKDLIFALMLVTLKCV